MTSKTVDIAVANTHLLELIDEVEHGTAVFLSKGDRVVAEIIPLSRRVMGIHAGSSQCADDFDAELADSFWTGRK